MAKGEQTRRRIIAQTMPVFNMHGYAGTSIAALTQATGLEKGGIYNHFASKQALALAAFDYAGEQIWQRFQEAIATETHAIEQLLAIVRVFEHYADEPPVPGGCPVFNTAIEADDTSPVLLERARQAMTLWHRLIGRIIKDGIARAELIPETNPYEIASLMTALLEGALALSRLYGDPIHLRYAARHLDGYLRGFALLSEEAGR